jgi:hypothetical protein
MKTTPGQLLLQMEEVRVGSNFMTHDLYLELRTKLAKNHQRRQIVQNLDRLARNGQDYELLSSEGTWIAKPAGKTPTGRYLWNLHFRPHPSMAA